jgi:hypothetical protein
VGGVTIVAPPIFFFKNTPCRIVFSLGYLAKLGFWFKIKARVKILPQAYT